MKRLLLIQIFWSIDTYSSYLLLISYHLLLWQIESSSVSSLHIKYFNTQPFILLYIATLQFKPYTSLLEWKTLLIHLLLLVSSYTLFHKIIHNRSSFLYFLKLLSVQLYTENDFYSIVYWKNIWMNEPDFDHYYK